jgi:hypothetical protein
MKIVDMKNELEKVAKVIPELRRELDEAYLQGAGKKSKIKLLWRQWSLKHKELRESKDFKNLNLQ